MFFPQKRVDLGLLTCFFVYQDRRKLYMYKQTAVPEAPSIHKFIQASEIGCAYCSCAFPAGSGASGKMIVTLKRSPSR